MSTAMLDWYRAAVVRKVAGLDPVVASTSPVRSGTTIIGLVKHLALVEDVWYTHRFAGDPNPSRGRRHRSTRTGTGSSTAPSTTSSTTSSSCTARHATVHDRRPPVMRSTSRRRRADSRSRCASPTSTCWRRRPATSGTSTSCASTSTAPSASTRVPTSAELAADGAARERCVVHVDVVVGRVLDQGVGQHGVDDAALGRPVGRRLRPCDDAPGGACPHRCGCGPWSPARCAWPRAGSRSRPTRC